MDSVIKHTQSECKEYSSEIYGGIILYRDQDIRRTVFEIALSESFAAANRFEAVLSLHDKVKQAELTVDGFFEFQFGDQNFKFKINILDKDNPRRIILKNNFGLRKGEC